MDLDGSALVTDPPYGLGDLIDERVRTAHFHIAHDGTVRHPATCSECRRLAETRALSSEPVR